MSVRYDPKSDTLRLSVTDLVRERRAASPASAGPQRSQLGREAHILHAEAQASIHDSYEPEVGVSLKLRVTNGTVYLNARIDGVWVESSRTILEEVKLRPLGMAELPLPGDRKQLFLYLWMWEQLHPDDLPASGQLTYLDPFSGGAESFPYHESAWPVANLQSEIEQRLAAILEYERKEAARLAERATHADEIVWPFDERRPMQQEMEDAVVSALSEKQHLVLAAPTGSGKTAPILLSAYRECVRNGWRLAFATSRTAQQADRLALIERAIPETARGRVVLLGSQERLGALPPNERGDDEIDPYAAPAWFRARLDDTGTITPEETKNLAGLHDVDAGVLQSAFAAQADVLVGDMNMFISGGRRAGWFEQGKYARPTVLLLDEAHSLVDRVRDQHAGVISMSDIAAIADETSFLAASWSDELMSALNMLAQEVDQRLKDIGERGISHERFDADDPSFSASLARISLLAPAMMAAGSSHETREKLRRLLRASSAASEAKSFAAYVDTMAGTVNWELMNTAQVLRPVWDSCRTAVLFSGTLSPLELTVKAAGLPVEQTDQISLCSPIDSSSRRVIRYCGLETTYRKREETLPALCELLVNAATQTNGAWLIFFPSRTYLEQVRSQLNFFPVSVMVLQAGLTSAMMRFLDKEDGPRLHLAVLGGKYAEGFDPPEGLYTGAAVISLGIPPPNARDELLSVFEAQGDEATGSPYLITGVRRVRQAGGRLFRTPDQAGILLLIDKRFEQPGVQDLLGEEWCGSEIIDDPEILAEEIGKWTVDHRVSHVRGQSDEP